MQFSKCDLGYLNLIRATYICQSLARMGNQLSKLNGTPALLEAISNCGLEEDKSDFRPLCIKPFQFFFFFVISMPDRACYISELKMTKSYLQYLLWSVATGTYTGTCCRIGNTSNNKYVIPLVTIPFLDFVVIQ